VANYQPQHQPQLGRGSPTESTDCGPRSTQMGLDDGSKGKVKPGPAPQREFLQDWNETNILQLDGVIDHFGARAGVSSTYTNSLTALTNHLKKGLGAVVATHYGVLRRLAPAKTGSETFNGGHALFIRGLWKRSDGVWVTNDWDPLNDGRYRGCPKGKVQMKWSAMKRALNAITPSDNIFANLIYPDQYDGGIEPDPTLPDPDQPTLFSLLADLREELGFDAQPVLDLEVLLGIDQLTDEDTAIIEAAFELPTE
jgi:hypothetical protein